jgi:putative membrane protein
MLPIDDPDKAARKERKQKEAELKDVRNFLAFERTLLAWVRTSTSLLTFGFAIAKLLQQEASGPGEHPVLKAVNPVNIGMTMIFFGFLGQVIAVSNYVRYARMFGKTAAEIYLNPSMIVSYVVILLSFSIVTAYVVRQIVV